jgi:alcohol dehydrogenase class IV
MKDFIYTGLPARVVFGVDTLPQLVNEIRALGGTRVLVISTPFQADLGLDIKAQLGDLGSALYTNATMHTPVDVTEDAMRLIKSDNIDCLVAVGGGSTIGLSKAIALRTGLPQVVVPTTYAGSEMTPILGQTEGGVKTTLRDLKVLPNTVLYDVRLTLTLPSTMSGTSGLNAIAHAVEALYAENTNPVINLMAEEGIRALANALPKLMDAPEGLEARKGALYGSWLCATCLGSVGMALHHKLCHTLGGTFDLPHAETHTIILPHATAYNFEAAPEAMAALSRALESETPHVALYHLGKAVGAEMALKDLGMPEDGIVRASELALKNQYYNPRPLKENAINDLLTRAWHGEAPRVG